MMRNSGLQKGDGVPKNDVVRRLPAGVVPTRLIGEGAANAVFEIQFPDGCASASKFRGWLLRVSKAPLGGGLSTFNYAKQQDFFVNKIKPLLGDAVVRQELVMLHGADLVPRLNAHLRTVDKTRKVKFQGSWIAETDWGLLVEDMRPENTKDWLLFEFKPKWLSQSPSAPPSAIRCRQCAMELFNLIKEPQLAKWPPEAKHCPLALANESALPEVASPLRIAPGLPLSDHLREALAFVVKDKLLSTLRAAQNCTDTDGPLHARKDSSSFALAMTIRDCTCFVTLSRKPQPKGMNRPARLCLGDFDWKDASVKFERWQTAERNLIVSGCYTADWLFCNGKFYHAPTRCLLEWSPRKSRIPEIICVQDRRVPITKETHIRRQALVNRFNHTSLHYVQGDCAPLVAHLTPYSKDSPKTAVCPRRIEPTVKPEQL